MSLSLSRSAFLALAISYPVVVHAGEIKEQTALSLTLYQNAPALIEDVRKVTLNKGTNIVVFSDVSDTLSIPSVQLSSAKGKEGTFTVLSKSYRTAASETDLLRAVEGQKVILLRSTPSGEVREQGRVLRIDPSLLFEINGNVRGRLPEESILFETLPEGIALKPALSAEIKAESEGSFDFSLRYLSTGLSWNADHIIELAPDGKSLSLLTNATLVNTTTMPVRSASLGLVAGTLETAGDSQTLFRTTPMAVSEVKPSPETLAFFHLYKTPSTITLEPGETRQIPLLSETNLKAQTLYHFVMPSVWYQSHDDIHPVPGQTKVLFKTDTIPLPEGVVRIYTKDKEGTSRYLGSSFLSATPTKQEAYLSLGQAFDVTAKRSTVEFTQVSDTDIISVQKIEISNASSDPVTVIVEDKSGGDMSILEESTKHLALDSTTIQWKLMLPAQSQQILTYKIRGRGIKY